MRERPVELAIPDAITRIPALTHKVMGFHGDTNVSKRYVGTRTLYRFYVFNDDANHEYTNAFHHHEAVEEWEWWKIGCRFRDPELHEEEIVGSFWSPNFGWPWRCYMCNSEPTKVLYRRVAYADLYFHRYIKRLPREPRVKRFLDENLRFMDRWICLDCADLLESTFAT